MNTQLLNKNKMTMKRTLIFVFLTAFLFNYQSIFAQKKEFIVVLDAGHGGKDPGKVNHNHVKEKDIALKIVLKVGEILEREKGIKVVYTRKTDVFVELMERGRIANKADADLFVSIHCNAHNSQASGAETWVLGTHVNRQNFEVAKAENSVILLEDNYEVKYKGFNPNSPDSVIGLTMMQEEYLDQSIQLASIIQEGFIKDLNRIDRGVKQAGFVVLHQTAMPSVLIETGFLTNVEEGAYLNSSIGQDKFSKSIASDILKYIQQLTLNTVVGNNIAQNDNNPVSKTNTPIADNSSNIFSKIIFKVQIASGANKIETKSSNFKGLKNVERVQADGSFKYYLGSTSDYTEIKKMHELAKSKGYSSAFIVAFENGKKIPVEDVIKKS
ncbi:MAG TPA: N-acetylmuramoyl-L-alanine amidase [Lutibacter sp.]|nr:N-acetylmuramoyl-L-alanine amidase [Lutibacter sp.]